MTMITITIYIEGLVRTIIFQSFRPPCKDRSDNRNNGLLSVHHIYILIYSFTYLLTYLLHGIESFLRS
jgi:hypothetical protein